MGERSGGEEWKGGVGERSGREEWEGGVGGKQKMKERGETGDNVGLMNGILYSYILVSPDFTVAAHIPGHILNQTTFETIIVSISPSQH